MSLSILTSKGQTTIPKKIREHLGLSPGDRLEFLITNEGNVVLKASLREVTELKGSLSHMAKARVSVEDMHKAIKARFKKMP